MLIRLLVLLLTITGALSIPSFIAQHQDNENECRFPIFSGTYVFQQFQSLRFDFVITAKGKCLDPPLVFLRDQTSISMAGSMTTEADTIRLSGEIQPSDMKKHLILVVPATDECDFEMQQQSSLSFQLPICRVGEQLNIDFEQPPSQNEADSVPQDVIDLLDDQEIPESVSGLLLIDAIRDDTRYHYKTKWKRLTKAERHVRESSYRQIRKMDLKIEPFITGDLSQQKEAEATAQATCAYLNSMISNPKQRVDFKKITISGFNKKWERAAFNRVRTFPEMIIKSKDVHLGQCHASSTYSGVLSAGNYVFRRLLQMQQPQSLNFNFQLKASDSIAAEGVGTTTTTEAGMVHLVGQVESSEEELILNIPSSKTCVYELVQASLTLQLPTDGECRIGDQLIITWEESKLLDPKMLKLVGQEMMQDVQDVGETVKDLTRESSEIPKAVGGLSLIDGIWNYVRFNYEAKWKELSKEERKGTVHAYRRLRNVHKCLERFIAGDLAQRSNAEATAKAAGEYLNSFTSYQEQQVDFQTVSVSSFQKNWIKFTPELDPTSPPQDPRSLPTSIVDLRLVDVIYNYVVYNYKGQWETLSAEEKKHFHWVYWMIRSAYLRIEPFRTGDLTDKRQVEATVQAALNSLFSNAQIDYKTMKMSAFHNKAFRGPRKRLRNN